MGCCSSKENTDFVRNRDGHRAGIHEALVKEFVDEDVYDVYDFTGPVLGAGAFATVLEVRNRVSGVAYAIKQVSLEEIKYDEATMRVLRNEIEGMKILSHPNIVRLQEVYKPRHEDVLYLVLDRLSGGSVEALRKHEGRLGEDYVAYIITQVVDAVRYCHDLGVAHRDLKLSNCMFEDDSPAPLVKIIDFGLCADLKGGKTSSAFVGTVTYAAPEVVDAGTSHGLQCDMFSVGVMTYALVTGNLPFFSPNKSTLIGLIKSSEPSYPEEPWGEISADCKSFVEKCLVKDPQARLTPKQAQEHPWIKAAVEAMKGEPLSRNSMLAMMRFQESNTFQRVAMQLIAYSYDPSNLTELEKYFREIDKDGSGTISLQEFKSSILRCKRSTARSAETASEPGEDSAASPAPPMTDAEVSKLAAWLKEPAASAGGETGDTATDPDASGIIGKLDEEGVERIFAAMDVDGNGTVDINEFIAACLGKQRVDDRAIRAAFQRLDQDRRGFISFEDVKSYLGDTFDVGDLEAYMRQISGRSDGQVSLQEFGKSVKALYVPAGLLRKGSARRIITISSTRQRETKLDARWPQPEVEARELPSRSAPEESRAIAATEQPSSEPDAAQPPSRVAMEKQPLAEPGTEEAASTRTTGEPSSAPGAEQLRALTGTEEPPSKPETEVSPAVPETGQPPSGPRTEEPQPRPATGQSRAAHAAEEPPSETATEQQPASKPATGQSCVAPATEQPSPGPWTEESRDIPTTEKPPSKLAMEHLPSEHTMEESGVIPVMDQPPSKYAAEQPPSESATGQRPTPEHTADRTSSKPAAGESSAVPAGEELSSAIATEPSPAPGATGQPPTEPAAEQLQPEPGSE